MSPRLHALLDQLVGTWRTQGRVVAGPGAGEAWSGHDVYEWFPGERHLVHRVDVEMAGHRSEGLELFTPRDEDSLVFDQVSFNADGSVEHAVGSFDAEGRYHNDLPLHRATLTFEGSDAMRATWERRDEGAPWSAWMDVRFTRIGPPHIEVRSKTDHATGPAA